MATDPPEQPPAEIPPEGPAETPPPEELPPEPKRTRAGSRAPLQGAGRPGGAGQSAGGPYPNPHSGKNDRGAEAGDEEALTNFGYHGGGQAGPRNHSDRDHHAAARPKPGR